MIARRLAERESSFLGWVGRVVFELGLEPYRSLLAAARCERGDLERLVTAEGLEPALARLRGEGVWVSYDEFKGRLPIVRDGRELGGGPGAFDNPLVAGGFEVRTGGSTGRPARVMVDLAELSSRAPNLSLSDEVHGIAGAPWALWFGTLPDSGLNSVLARVPYGSFPERWFVPLVADAIRRPLRMRVANDLAVRIARALGVGVPWPEPVALTDAVRIARWLAARVSQSGRAVLRAYVSLGLRVAQAARAEGIDLSGAVISGGGEPPTETKVAEIERSGARFLPSYSFSEAGPVALPCARPCEVNDLHLLTDRLALVQADRPVGETSVPAFLFTSLLPTAPKLLLNVESDDYGVVERRSCGCGLEAAGYAVHVRRIRSFGKLTGEGMTLVGSDLLRLLESELPRRFLASAADFQLQERESPGGLTRLHFVVSPRVRAGDDELLEALRRGLAGGTPASSLARAIWREAESVVIERREPDWTARGKLLPLHLQSRARVAEETAR